MIELTKMNDQKIFLNPNLVEIVEGTPDTLITTISGRKYYVMESVQEVSQRIMQYYININVASRRTRKAL